MSLRKPSAAASNGGEVSLDERKQEAMDQYQQTDGHFSLVRYASPTISSAHSHCLVCAYRNFRLADLVTIANGICGSFSIFMSAKYLLTSDEDYLWSALAFPLAGLFFDFLDGKVARWRNESSMIGQELDSLADLVRSPSACDSVRILTCSLLSFFPLPRLPTQISFGVAPALLAFVAGFRTYLDTVVLTGFICCGLARLARFNATVASIPKDAKGKAHYFEGLPIPSSLGLVAVLSYWTSQGWIEGKHGIPWGTITLWGAKGGDGELHTFSIVFGLWAAAMVSKTLRVPKI